MSEDNIARNILANGEASPEEEITIEQEFRDLYTQSISAQRSFARLATTIEGQTGNVTKKDLAGLYRFLAEDIMGLLSDNIKASGAALIDILEGDVEDEEDEEGEEEEIPQSLIQAYSALGANEAIFKKLVLSSEGEQQTGLEQMVALNRASIDSLDTEYPELAELSKSFIAASIQS